MEPLKESLKRRRRMRAEMRTKEFRARIEKEKSWTDRLADFLTHWFGTVEFLILNAIIFFVWISWNTSLGQNPFDPFPFGLLTMIVSLEAIFLSIIVLLSQNRQSMLADVRQELDFEIDVRAEEEITKILKLLDGLRRHAGINDADEELEEMLQKTDILKIEEYFRHSGGR